MFKVVLLASALALAPFCATAQDLPFIFKGPGGTQVYADAACRERTPSPNYDLTKPLWIDCAVDGMKTSILISLVPPRSGRNLYRYEDTATIVDHMTAGTNWEGYSSSIKFQGGGSGGSQIDISYLQSQGIRCYAKFPCGFEGDKVQLIVLGHRSYSVGLLAIGAGEVDEIKVLKGGKETLIAAEQRFPRPLEAMMSTFSFSTFRMQSDSLRTFLCKSGKDVCLPKE